MRWEDPPPILHAKTKAWVDRLKEKPWKWALILEDAASVQATQWRRSLGDEFEFTMRDMVNGRGALYARYTPRKKSASTVPCTVPKCGRAAVARGMCMMHYKRVRAGKPAESPEAGQPIGYGQYGVLDAGDESVVCHECGEAFPDLGSHVKAHEMTAREYKLRYGLPLTKPLASKRITEERAARARERLGSSAWSRFEEARNPRAASAARTEESFSAVSERARAHGVERARENGRRARIVRVHSCPICGIEWCPMPGGYRRITDRHECWVELLRRIRLAAPKRNAPRDAEVAAAWRDGLSYDTLGTLYGVSGERIGQIIRDQITTPRTGDHDLDGETLSS